MLVCNVGIYWHLCKAKEQEEHFMVCADDAGARTVKFCLDLRQHPTGEVERPPECHTDTIKKQSVVTGLVLSRQLGLLWACGLLWTCAPGIQQCAVH